MIFPRVTGGYPEKFSKRIDEEHFFVDIIGL
jgi:hypothetical protein